MKKLLLVILMLSATTLMAQTDSTTKAPAQGGFSASYQKAFALYKQANNTEALMAINDAIAAATDAKLKATAYSLQGSVYNNLKQPQKAIAAYRNAIAADSTNQRIYYNLGIAQFQSKAYADAEQSFAAALKRDAKDAGSARMYALSAFHQNNRAEALLGLLYFLSLEPAGARSAEAFGNLQNILQGGALKAEPGYRAPVTPYITFYNNVITKALNPLKTRRYASATDLFAAQIAAVVTALGNQPREKGYFWQQLADHFSKVAAAGQMPALARYISQSTLPESAKWFRDNPEKAAGLQPLLQPRDLN